MKYFFILGSNPTLSLAELAAVFPVGNFSLPQKNIALLETDGKISSNLLNKIGGTIKFGAISGELASANTANILKAMSELVPAQKSDGKFMFGISYYGKIKLNQKVLGMEFKKTLKQAGVSSRWVISKEPTLSSVVVEQNKLTTERGLEIILIKADKKLLLGKTLTVQPFKDLSFRDYGRPARDDRSGMLPPKLAQIMINLADIKTDDIILDPFCGSGTILTEAALMGFKNLTGADISPKAVADTKTNLTWLKENYQLPNIKYQILNADAAQISRHFKPGSVDAIITEPYLGPQRGRLELNKVKAELEQLYSRALEEFNKILKPGGRLIMIWPVFPSNPKTIFLEPRLNGLKIISPIPENLKNHAFIKQTFRQTIVYGREDQKVWREIAVLRK